MRATKTCAYDSGFHRMSALSAAGPEGPADHAAAAITRLRPPDLAA
jgi:hypothetical protein